MAKLTTLKSMSGHDWLLFLEATLLLAFARFCVRFIKIRHYVKLLGPLCDETAARDTNANQQSRDEILAIGQQIKRAANNVPWQAVCLPQAMVGKWMLRRRGISSEMFLGLARGESAELKAHAWLRAGDVPVTGTEISDTFTQVSRFC